MNLPATFRFYAGLNEHLPPSFRMRTLSVSLRGRVSIRQTTDSLGIPSDAIDLILVNGDPVDPAYAVQPGDRVSIYPKFETFDISILRRH
ncbi:MAG: hypothetical protein HYY48_00845 [Gammaproteobacteria bacterium]|nr:hypothetical protein [Gammaproteobacteria bacterium]